MIVCWYQSIFFTKKEYSRENHIGNFCVGLQKYVIPRQANITWCLFYVEEFSNKFKSYSTVTEY